MCGDNLNFFILTSFVVEVDFLFSCGSDGCSFLFLCSLWCSLHCSFAVSSLLSLCSDVLGGSGVFLMVRSIGWFASSFSFCFL